MVMALRRHSSQLTGTLANCPNTWKTLKATEAAWLLAVKSARELVSHMNQECTFQSVTRMYFR